MIARCIALAYLDTIHRRSQRQRPPHPIRCEIIHYYDNMDTNELMLFHLLPKPLMVLILRVTYSICAKRDDVMLLTQPHSARACQMHHLPDSTPARERETDRQIA